MRGSLGHAGGDLSMTSWLHIPHPPSIALFTAMAPVLLDAGWCMMLPMTRDNFTSQADDEGWTSLMWAALKGYMQFQYLSFPLFCLVFWGSECCSSHVPPPLSPTAAAFLAPYASGFVSDPLQLKSPPSV